MRCGWIRAAALVVAALLPCSLRAEQHSFAEVEAGRYLATAGNCRACHTHEGGEPFAGGRPIETPFGVIYSPNITPDRETGIGGWSDDQFYRAMHQGIANDGGHLYPAFPYPWYTKVTRRDVLAIRAFLDTVDPVKAQRPPNGLAWPLNYRFAMSGWDELFFREGEFLPDPSKTAEQNRGAYLVEGLGHCGACHTQTNIFGASEQSAHLQGGALQNWYAPSLAGDLRSGLGSWSEAEIVDFLKIGRNDKTAAYGLMSEVIAYSTSKLSDADLKAIASYLKEVPATSASAPEKPDPALARAGEAVYIDNCAACHRSDGKGTPGMFPPLAGDAMAQSKDATTVIRLILEGGHAVATDARPTAVSMPSFRWKLSNAQIAAVATYIRNAWGNAASPIAASDVQSVRRATATAGK